LQYTYLYTYELNVYHTWGMRNAYSILVGKIQGMRPTGRPSYRGEDNIKIVLI